MPVIWRSPERGGLTPDEEDEKDLWMAGVHPLQQARQTEAPARDWLARRSVQERRVRSSTEPDELAIEFRPHRRPRYEVNLAYGARRAIEQEIHLEAPRGLETGGLLYSLYPPGRNDLHVVHATGPARNSRHSRHSVVIGTIAGIEAEMPDFLRRAGMLCVGSFHTHPSLHWEPSSTDRKQWASMLTRRSPCFFGVIATRHGGGHGWSLPDLHAWLAYRDQDGAAVIEPAKVVGAGE